VSDALKQRIVADMKAAMKAQDKQRLAAIRLITAAIKQVEVDERIASLDDERVLVVLRKMVKQRRDSIEQFRAGGRDDLVERESFELELIQGYLPQVMSGAELDALIEAAMAETGAGSARDMGKVMALLRGRLQGRADMGEVSARVKGRLDRPA
jgi:hypothetical protein